MVKIPGPGRGWALVLAAILAVVLPGVPASAGTSLSLEEQADAQVPKGGTLKLHLDARGRATASAILAEGFERAPAARQLPLAWSKIGNSSWRLVTLGAPYGEQDPAQDQRYTPSPFSYAICFGAKRACAGKVRQATD